jgi:hypothetical protein
MVCCFEFVYLKLHVLSSEVFPSLEGHRKSDLADRGHRFFRDYFVERSPTWMHRGSIDHHLVEGLQEQDVHGASPINEDSVELDILDDGADNQ